MLNELSLFSGYGGFSLGLKLAGLDVRTVGYVEIDKYCQQIVDARIRDGMLDWAPIIRDIKFADFRPMAGVVDLVTAGFPCQPHSVAGQRRGEADERNLWPDTLRVIREVGPSYVILENVPGLLVPNGGAGNYAATVVGELSAIGYDCVWHCVPAAAVGAPHLRWRWWCLAYTRCSERRSDNSSRREGRGELLSQGKESPVRLGASGEAMADTTGGESGRVQQPKLPAHIGASGQDGDVADADGLNEDHAGRRTSQVRGGRPEAPGIPGCAVSNSGQLRQGRAADTGETARGGPLGQPTGSSWWAVEPELGGRINGTPPRMDRH